MTTANSITDILCRLVETLERGNAIAEHASQQSTALLANCQGLLRQTIEQSVDDPLLSVAEAAKLLGVTKSAVYQMVDAGRIKPTYKGGRIFIKRSELLRDAPLGSN